MQFEEELKRKTELTERALSEYFIKKDNYQKTVYDAMEYSLFAGGKRIRPVLTLAAAALFSDERSALPFACALEMIHTYSLIHDDLPCMDDDALRRGKPTNHVVFGEATAVLAGDALLTRAFEVALRHSRLPAETTLRILSVLAEASGTEGMIGGQIIDMESEGKSVDADVLHAMHLCKTGALIVAAAKMGAMAGGGKEEDILRLEAYARDLGLAFQIKDDILDVEGDAGLLGKKTGADEQSRKTTFISLFGLTRSKQMLSEYTERSKEQLSVYGERAEFLLALADFLLAREK